MKRLFKKVILRIFIALIALGLLAVPALYLIAINSPTVSAAWFNDNWAYRKAVSTTIASNSSDLSNLQMLLTVDTSTGANGIGSGKIQASCQDLRFTNQAGKLLPYYIDSGCTTTSTKIWVMVDLVPKNTTTMTLYMYYGNPSASSGSSTQYFDNVVGLVGYWNMNESSWNGTSGEVKDMSVNGNNGTAAGNATTTASGQYSNAGTFDGSGDYASVANSNSLAVTGSITVSAWVYHNSQGGDIRVVNKDSVDDTSGYTLYLSNNNVAGKIGSGGNCYRNSSSAVANTTWTHIAMIADGSTLRLYKNGVQVDSTNCGSVLSNTSILAIGSYNNLVSQQYSGSIDDVKIYNTARTAAQILNDYNNKLPNGQTLTIASTAPTTVIPTTSIPTDANAEKAPSPAAYWKFDDAQGQTAQDSTVNNNDGTLGASTAVSSDDPTWQTEDLCVTGKCLKFDGGDYTNMGDPASGILDMGSDDFTISSWIRTGSTSRGFIAEKDQSNAGNASWFLSVESNGTVQFMIGTTGGDYTAQTTATVSDNKWHHVVGVRDSGVSNGIKIYIDGKQNGTPASDNGGTVSNSESLYIGIVDGASLPFTGFIDEVKIYPYARSAAQILADYNSRGNNEGVSFSQGDALSTQGVPLKALSNGLVGYWKMDEASANSCSGGVNDNCDSSGNGNDGGWNGDATSAAGKYGNGTTFDGTGDYVSVTDPGANSPLDITGNLTISAWVKSSSANDKYILTKGDDSYYLGHSIIGTTGFCFYLNGSVGSGWLCSGTSIADNNWHHVVATYDQSNMRVYVDGILKNSQARTIATLVGNSALWIGERFGNPTLDWNGQIDDVRIYNRALSPKEVSDLYNFAPGPKVYLKMDEKSGTSAFDSSGNGRTGTINGNPLWSTGKYGSGIKMDGTGDNITISDF